MIIDEVTVGPCRLILGDGLEVLPSLDADAIVTDPPYGIGEDGGAARTRGSRRTNGPAMGWDNERPQREAFDLMRSRSDHQIIWGGNYFADYLPASRGWLYWHKLMGGDFADGELAWTSIDMVLKALMKSKETRHRVHPTQKPLYVMEWSLTFIPQAKTVVDPYMGSGTTGLACMKAGKRFVGIEREPSYWSIAVERHRRMAAILKASLPFDLPREKQATLSFSEDAHR